ncbi:sterigmatocystin biosynthesis P450 monooxygenase StcS [Massariosphaeria phaeospora]|uniref:Sterigmatocystin biosynthesis P450 monooxygenase StcS n=1 Tax=Massariosphaeria phaeospora TaxID=100035 RepID=A0A7C8M6X0_9PLEO|nr:sterigmatocystin biosynthesis P450 monooxygenase StcS [Massariosphaeria phaeospora]
MEIQQRIHIPFNLRSMSAFNISLLVGLTSVAGLFLTKLYRARMLLRDRQRRGLPVAPNHSLLFGHLFFLLSVLKRLPKDAHYQYSFALIAREHFYNEGCYYLDLWPMGALIMITVSPQIGIQITQTNAALHSDRPHLLRRFFKPITGGPSLFDMDEKDWKPWRAVFNKGFHNVRTMSLVPGIVEETLTYAETLRGLAAKGEMCFLEPVTLRFTIDMIGKNVLNTSLGAQRGYNPLADGMLSTLSWHNPNAVINPFSRLDFVRAFIYWKNGRQMNQYIGAELDKRYVSYKTEPNRAAPESVMDLVLQAYMSGPDRSATPPEKLDSDFRDFATRQIRLFLFAGYDSTGSVLCYCFHLLSKNPEVLARLRAEHDEVLGPDPAAGPSRLIEDARLVNSLQYTLAVIKEVMRLFPPAGANRVGKPGVFVTNDEGVPCMTEDAIFQISHIEMQASPKYWVRADEFLPERWLVPAGHELHPRPGAWRPFELGPRNCIAQALVLVELRVILACLVRTFDVAPAYDEYDEKYQVKGIKTYRGERAYNIEKGAAHPVAQYPCRITLAGQK